MRCKLPALLLTLLPLAMSGTALAQTDCPALPGSVTLACTANEHGLFYAASEQDSREMAAAAVEAASNFQRHFGRTSPKGAVIETEQSLDAAMGNQKSAWLAQHGLAFVHAWYPPAARTRLDADYLLHSIQQVQPQIRESTARDLAQRAAQQAARHDPAQRGSASSILMRQLGITYLRHAFWPEGANTPHHAPSYGSPAPDWLDEVVTVLMEAPTASHASIHNTAAADIRSFLSSTHPSLARFGTQDFSVDRNGRVRLPSHEESAARYQPSQQFYLQARALADFLRERSHDPAVFGAIASAAKEQKTFSDWLAENGPRFGLPRSMSELEQHWQAWLAEKTRSH